MTAREGHATEVWLWYRARPEDHGALTRAFQEVSAAMAGVDGLLGSSLLRADHDPDAFAVVCRWRERAAFHAWAATAVHRRLAAPLDRFRDVDLGEARMRIHQVVDRYDPRRAGLERAPSADAQRGGMDIDLKGRTVVITGAARGIGRSIATTFAGSGADVLGCYRSDDTSATATLRELEATGGRHRMVRADIAISDGVAAVADAVAEAGGHVDVLVHNASAISHVPFPDLDVEEWEHVVRTNLTAPFALTQRLLPHLAAGSSVVAIGSRVARVGVELRSHYGSSKAGLRGLVRSLSRELGGRGIRVNLVEPGVVETEKAADVPPERLERYRAMTSLGRLGRPDEIAAVVAFLGSDLSSYLTGACLEVNGGM